MTSAEVADRVAWLSGRSSPRHAALSPDQRRLLAAAEPAGFNPVETGYPFPEQTAAWHRSALLAASARNARQYAALGRPGATAEVAAALSPFFAAAGARLLLVCGSLGLELLATGLPALPAGPRLRVVALGPVCRVVPPDLDLVVAQGGGDLVSRLGYRGPVHRRVRCGHLGYVGLPEVRELVAEAARRPW